MKIKNKILIIFICSIIINIFLFLSISLFLKSNYKDIKYTSAYKYYEKTSPSIEEYANYLIDKGFIVTRNEIEGYKTSIEATCHEQTDQIIIYKDKSPALYAVINDKIINDFLMLLDYTLGAILIIIIILLMLIYFIFNNLILKRITKLEQRMIMYDKGETVHKVEKDIKNFNDEIAVLEKNFEEMIYNINQSQESKKKLIMAISHELKSPITKINAIIEMYKNNTKGYSNKEEVCNLILEQSNYISKNINKLLTFYNDYKSDLVQQKVDILNLIKNKFSDDIFKHNKFIIKSDNVLNFKVLIDEEKLNIILNNIKNNLYSYCKKDTNIYIYIKDKQVIIQNTISDKASNSTKVGNVINDFLAYELKLTITNEVIKNQYIVTINFTN